MLFEPDRWKKSLLSSLYWPRNSQFIKEGKFGWQDDGRRRRTTTHRQIIFWSWKERCRRQSVLSHLWVPSGWSFLDVSFYDAIAFCFVYSILLGSVIVSLLGLELEDDISRWLALVNLMRLVTRRDCWTILMSRISLTLSLQFRDFRKSILIFCVPKCHQQSKEQSKVEFDHEEEAFGRW